jgi:quinol monooxygenase YgiN
MILRIVKLHFTEKGLETFEISINEYVDAIKSQDGCKELMIYKDVMCQHTILTYSKWDSIEHLNNYRKSETFGKIWPETKKLFSKKPEVYSLDI